MYVYHLVVVHICTVPVSNLLTTFQIIWDEEKKQWVDLTADPTEQAGPPPPPTDSQLTQTRPNTNAPPTSGQGGGPMGGPMTSSTSAQPGSSLPSGGGAEVTDGPVPTKSSYSMQVWWLVNKRSICIATF